MKPVLRRLAILTAGDLAGRVLGFLTTVYLARTLQPGAFGLITVGTAVLGYLLLAASPGIQTVEVRNVAAGRVLSRTAVADVLGLRVVLAVLLWSAAGVAALIMVKDDAARDVILLYAAALLPLAVLLDWFFAGREEFRIVGLGRTAAGAAVLVLTLFLVRSSDDVRGAPVAFAAGSMAGAAVFALAFRRRYGTLRFTWNPAGWKDVLRRNLPVGTAAMLGQSALNLPPIVAAVLLTPEETGVLGAALRLVPAVLLADRVLHALLLPAMTRYWAASQADTRRLYGAGLRLVAFGAVPAALLGAAAASPLIALVYGPAYAGAAPAFTLLLGYVVLTLLNTVSLTLILAAGRDRAYTRIMLLSTAALTALLLLLTPLHGAAGAAAAVAAGELVLFLLLGREVRTLLGSSPAGLLLRMGIPALVLALWIGFGSAVVPPHVHLPAGAALFLLAAGSVRVFTREEWTFITTKLL